MSKNGLILLTPTTVDKTGASSTATISTNGSVEFGSCESLSLNGVFSANYDNYMIVCRHTPSTSVNVDLRLRSGGANNSSANSYVRQFLGADGASASANRFTSDKWDGIFTSFTTIQQNGAIIYVFGPYLSQPTAFRSNTIQSNSGAGLVSNSGTHNQSVSYDGISLILSVAGYTLSGRIAVYGMRK
jgi:hypothetical protein